MQHMDGGSPFAWGMVDAVPPVALSRNSEFGQGAGDSLLALSDAHHGIFNVNQVMPADGTSSLTSIQVVEHTLMPCPACE